MSICCRRYLEYEGAGAISFRLIEIAFRQEYDLGIFRHFDFADSAKSIASEFIRFKTLRPKTFVAHYSLQNCGARRLLIIWVIPFSHGLVFLGCSFAGWVTDPSLLSWKDLQLGASIFRESFGSARPPRSRQHSCNRGSPKRPAFLLRARRPKADL